MATRVVLCSLALTATSSLAAADPGFAWEAPAGCPDAADVERRVARRLGGPLDVAVHGLEIAVVRDRAGFAATIDARSMTVANDVRTLRSARCDALADAVAVILARLASEARAVVSPVSPPAGSAGYAVPRDRTLALVAAAAPPPRPRTWGGGGRALGVSGVGALPRVNLGAELAGYVRHEARFAELALARWVPEGPAHAGAPMRPVTLDVATVRVGWRPEAVPLRAWLAGEVGAFGGGVTMAGVRAETARWTAVGAGFGVAWPMAPMARLVGTVELAVPVTEIAVALPSGTELYRPSPAAARCAFGLEVGWP